MSYVMYVNDRIRVICYIFTFTIGSERLLLMFRLNLTTSKPLWAGYNCFLAVIDRNLSSLTPTELFTQKWNLYHYLISKQNSVAAFSQTTKVNEDLFLNVNKKNEQKTKTKWLLKCEYPKLIWDNIIYTPDVQSSFCVDPNALA